jgi:rubrerythrin
MEEIMTKTADFLRSAFAGESQTNRKYLAYAAKAEEEGYPQAARLFRAAAESETVHAHNYLRALMEIRNTRDNLQEALAVETNACQNRIPEMMAAARAEGNPEAEKLFRYTLESEKIHARLFQKLLDTLEKPGEAISYYICSECGHTAEKQPPKVCPVCSAGGQLYRKTE